MDLVDRLNESLKNESVDNEINVSYCHLTEGIRHLDRQKSSASNKHVLLQDFASGFERLIKILLLIKEKHTTGNFPQQDGKNKFFRVYRNGHGIKEMLEELLKYAKYADLTNRTPMFNESMEYLEKNPVFVEIIDLLSDFAHQNRYDNIDTISQKNPASNINHITPVDRFRRVIYTFSKGKDVSHLTEKEEERANLDQMIIHIEIGIRALCHFFTHVFKGYNYGPFGDFIVLADKDLGQLKYLKPKTDPQVDYRPIDEQDERYQRIFKHARKKTLDAIAFPKWPFKVNRLTVLNLEDRYYLTEIDNKIFALNGKAQAHYKIPSYLASDQLKPREYALYLLEEAKKI